MVIGVIRIIKRIARDNVLDWTVTALSTLSDVSPTPPLTVAINVVLSILRVISDVKINQRGCIRLVQQATDMLIFLQRHMEGKGDARQSLLDDIREFEDTLLSIHGFIFQLTKMSLVRRGLERLSIQDELMQHERKLNAAERRFQLSSSIEMRYVLGAPSAVSSNNPRRIPVDINPTESPEALSSFGCPAMGNSVSSREVVQKLCGYTVPPFPTTPVPTEEEKFLADINGDSDEFGFRRYHQSDVIIGKANCTAVGWFSGTSEAVVSGQKMTIKRYDGGKDLTLKEWVTDIKKLRSIHHGNLPQILGYSDGNAATPFILLAGEAQIRDLSSAMRSTLTTRSPADCASMILRTYRDIASVIAYAQQQLALSEIDAHHFIDHATYCFSSSHNVVVGLPSPREDLKMRYLGGLEPLLVHLVLLSLRELIYVGNENATLRVGPCDRAVSLNKRQQLHNLLSVLLPQEGEGLGLFPELENLLRDADERNPLTLRALQSLSMHQSQFVRSLYGKSLIRPLTAGDYGYISGDLMDFSNFVLVGNIQDGESGKEMEQVVDKADCKILMYEHDPVACQRSNSPAGASLIPDERECWQVPLLPESYAGVRVSHETGVPSVEDALAFLVAHGPSLALSHGVKPQHLILVTWSRRDDYYDITGWFPSSRAPSAIEFDSLATSGDPALPLRGCRAEADSDPSMVYFVTSPRPDFEAYITDEPLGPRPQHPSESASSCERCYCWDKREFGNYIQLDADDAES